MNLQCIFPATIAWRGELALLWVSLCLLVMYIIRSFAASIKLKCSTGSTTNKGKWKVFLFLLLKQNVFRNGRKLSENNRLTGFFTARAARVKLNAVASNLPAFYLRPASVKVCFSREYWELIFHIYNIKLNPHNSWHNSWRVCHKL